jgi:hypothetical protein
MSRFIFDGYEFDVATNTAVFKYRFPEKNLTYTETIVFKSGDVPYSQEALVRALDLSHVLTGVSYYKAFPTSEVEFTNGGVDGWQADFFNKVYQEGLSQYAYENELTRDDLAKFVASMETPPLPAAVYDGRGIVSMQSGGKDSLLVATLLDKSNTDYTPFYISSSNGYPAILDSLKEPLVLAQRKLDREGLRRASSLGGKNGHVPVTYIAMSYALVQAILLGKNTVLVAIAHEGEEPHGWIGDLPVNHQWSKTWQAEQLFAEYVRRYISPDIIVGSPLRRYSELKVSQLFADHAWPQFGKEFSSCNVANYKQGANNSKLTWCGQCPKCANSYLLFAPFINKNELQARLGGELFTKPELVDTFKGLLGVDGIMKPFECVGEVEELRRAYRLAVANGYAPLPFEVPLSDFDMDSTYDSQEQVSVVTLGF